MSLSPYRSSEDRERTLEHHARALGGSLHVLGRSREGRPIRAVQVPSTGASPVPLLVCAGIHGLEYIGTEIAFGVLEALGAGLIDLRARAELWVLPSLNPDAYERTWARGGAGKLPELRKNAGGVDLNRNYPLPAPLEPVLVSFGGWRTGSSDPKNAFYRGAAPLSEPETAALDALCKRVPFHASINLHSTMGSMITPCLLHPRENTSYKALCAAFAGAQRVRYKRITGGRFDRFIGEQEDHQHHVHRAWAICVEHYPVWVDPRRFVTESLFFRFNPREPRRWIDNDVPAIAAYFRAALDLPRPG